MEKLTCARAGELLSATTTEAHLLQHSVAVSAAMGAMARHFGGDEEHWRAVGILHDYDYQQYPNAHLKHTEEPLRQAGVDEEALRAILAHGFGLCSDVEPLSRMENSLYAVDELTGLISATAKMRPGGITDLEPGSVKKKFKDKAFAAKIDRAVIKDGAERLGIELSELISLCIEGMRPYAAQLGLAGAGAKSG